MNISVEKQVNEKDGSVTTTISFKKALSKELAVSLEENGITDSTNNIATALNSAYISNGFLHASISSTIYP